MGTPPLDAFLSSLGFKNIKVLYEKNYATNGVPDDAKARDVARAASKEGVELVSLDNEFGDRLRPETVIPQTLELIRLFRNHGNSFALGVYATAPQATYGWHPEKLEMTEGLNVQYKSVAEAVDVLSPALYNYDGHDFEKWKRSAYFHISQSKIYGGKPIIPYISPYVELKKTEVPRNGVKVEELTEQEMRERLNVLYDQGADGCIVWASSQSVGPDNKQLLFDPSRGWGKALVEFIREHQQ
ncbi:hypothetical protein [Caballeronia calidae]|uniref:hypothetical protein n=1 Tax=Caballeronia calidae TaxID=1777139 RepID=UPI0012FDE3EB|nr:hypothetical protein [Caballeronia calidae]